MPPIPQPGPVPQTVVPHDRPMGRILTPDPRDANYRARERLRGAVGKPTITRRRSRYFLPPKLKDWRDQGPKEQSCTEHAAVHRMTGWPNPRPIESLTFAQHSVYHDAQKRDGWPGEEPAYYGTSERAVCEVLRDLGYVTEWWNAFTVDEVLDLILHDTTDWSVCGPVCIGVNWYEGMQERDAQGYVHPTGRVVGGHEVLLNGANMGTETLHGVNSWADMRLFRIRFEDFRRLLEREDGDAIFFREVPYKRPFPNQRLIDNHELAPERAR